MSCPSSRTRTPDNGRLLALSFGDESVAAVALAATPSPIIWTLLRCGSSAQHSQSAAHQDARRRDPARAIRTKSSEHTGDQKIEMAFK